MKKLLTVLMALMMVLSLTACKASTSTSNKNSNLEGTLEEILEKIYETAKLDNDFNQYVKPRLQTEQITAEKTEYYLGKAGIEFETAIGSESMMRPSSYSLCLVKVKEGADIEKIKKDIKENVNPAKWICTGVDPENVIVDSIGDVIFLVMSDDYAKPLHDAFLALKK
ncbi:hypothetical protein GCM10008905_08500 [Clostridium malenominatum]|uniref:DUF4358 domain-containing protein n=1 Tax=Clostridium malenominatum TaxID=1539 RepID=A0ABN1IRN8_9CLOT